MGISGYLKIINSRYNVIQNINNNIYDYILIDANHLLHASSYKSINVDMLIKNFIKSIDNILMNFLFKKGLVIAIDGTSPYAKVILQRKRREIIGSKDDDDIFNALSLTPGTDIMKMIDISMEEYIHTLKNKFNIFHPFIKYIPSSVPDEGELKIFNELHKVANQKNKYLVIGNDADLILLGCASKIPNIDIYFKQNSHNSILSINKLLYRFNGDLDPKLKLQKLINIKIHNSLDYVLISLMAGNDYLPKISFCMFDKILDSYITLKNKLINHETLQFYNNNLIEFFMILISKLTKNYKKPNLESYNSNKIKHYLEGLLWCLYMYRFAKCPKYDYIIDINHIEPMHILLYLIINGSEDIVVPKSNILPLDSKYYTLLTLPKSKKNMIPKQYHKYLELTENKFNLDTINKIRNIIQ